MRAKMEWLLGATLSLASATSVAAVLYSNTTDTFTTVFGASVRDMRPTWNDATQFPARPFELKSDAAINRISVAVTGSPILLTIYEDAGPSPGKAIVTVSMPSGALPPKHGTSSSYSLTALDLQPTNVQGRARYWLGMSCIASCEASWWGNPSLEVLGAVESNNSFPYALTWRRATHSDPYFRIEGTAHSLSVAPTWTLLALGIFALACGAQRTRR